MSACANLVSPKLPETLKYSELVDVFKQHYEPQPLVNALLPNAFISIAATKPLVNLFRNTWQNYADSRQIAIFVITWNKHSVTDWFVAYVTKASNAACWPKPNSH